MTRLWKNKTNDWKKKDNKLLQLSIYLASEMREKRKWLVKNIMSDYVWLLEEWLLNKFDIDNMECHLEIKNHIPKYWTFDNFTDLIILAFVWSY